MRQLSAFPGFTPGNRTGGGATVVTRRVHRYGRAAGTIAVTVALLSACKPPLAEGPGEPQDGVSIYPGDDLQSAVNANPIGTTFYLRPGVHRLQQVVPKSEDRFVGLPGAVLSGARPLTSFARSGAYWMVDAQSQEGDTIGICRPERPRCNRPEDLFFDDVPLQHVTALTELGPGKWYFDYSADRIYLVEDPRGHTVETSVAPWAFSGAIRDVTIRDIVIEKYANPATRGVIDGSTGVRWIVQDNEIRLNHGIGVRIGPAMQLRGNRIHHQGQLGIGGGGEAVLVEGNELSYNNGAGFSTHWEAGGTKFSYTTDLIVRENYSHHNHGPGLWTDINNIRTLYEGNRVEENDEAGIFHEISYAAVIKDNVITRNGWAATNYTTWPEGSGILVNSSSDVEITGNVLTGNANGIGAVQSARGSGIYGPYLVSNLNVHGNTVTQATGMIGIQQDAGDTAVFTSRNNRFEANIYYLNGNATPFRWLNLPMAEAAWKSAGNDLQGEYHY